MLPDCIQIEITCSTLVTMALKELTGNLEKVKENTLLLTNSKYIVYIHVL